MKTSLPSIATFRIKSNLLYKKQQHVNNRKIKPQTTKKYTVTYKKTQIYQQDCPKIWNISMGKSKTTLNGVEIRSR